MFLEKGEIFSPSTSTWRHPPNKIACMFPQYYDMYYSLRIGGDLLPLKTYCQH